MANLLQRKEKDIPNVIESDTTDRRILNKKTKKKNVPIKGKIIEKDGVKKYVYDDDRKNLKLSETDLRAIKGISTAQNLKTYEVINKIVNYYVENGLDDRTRKIIQIGLNEAEEKAKSKR